MFQTFCENIKLTHERNNTISTRYGEVTSALNKEFRDTDSKTANTIQVGSYGRKTAIKGISDLDMVYVMPSGKWDKYKDNQSGLLTDTKNAILERYPKTTVKVDRLVVQVIYSDFMIEVQPVFEFTDGNFRYPDTYDGGSWKITKPREEIQAIREVDAAKNYNLRKLCKMARAWKNKNGVVMGGLLIDTLAHNFLNQTSEYDDKSYSSFDFLSRDFFEYLKDQPDQDYYLALGSNQKVYVKKKFQSKARAAYKNCVKAIDAGEKASAHKKWKKVFGRHFPAKEESLTAMESAAKAFRLTEEFIEDQYPVDIRYSLDLECEVSQNGFRTDFLTNMLRRGLRLQPKKTLYFTIKTLDVPDPDLILWKVLNCGPEAEKRDCLRGQIFPDKGHRKQKETTDFKGDHVVECYAVKNGVVVARGRILVPIETNREDYE
jgi:hypothetical protein